MKHGHHREREEHDRRRLQVLVVLTPAIVIQLSGLRVSFLSASVLEPAATLGAALVAVATGLTVLILDPKLAGDDLTAWGSRT